MQKYLSWKAILIGTATSVALGLVSQVVLMFIMVGYIMLTSDYPQSDGYYQPIGFTVGSLLLVMVMLIGGYVTAYNARRNIYVHALIVGLLVSLVSLLTTLSTGNLTIVSVVFLLLGVGSILAGAHYWRRQQLPDPHAVVGGAA